MGNAGQVNYVASKSGVIWVHQGPVEGIASRNITVNAVAPGLIDTDMTAELGESLRSEMQKQIR